MDPIRIVLPRKCHLRKTHTPLPHSPPGVSSIGSRIVSVRVDEAVLKELEREGVNPSQVSRKAIEAEAARIRTQRALVVLKKGAVGSRESAVDIIRRLREDP